MTQDDLSQALSSANSVTNYAQAVVTAVPDLPDPPAWFSPIQTDINTVQSHNQGWIDNVCPAVTATIPSSVIQFNIVFQSAATQLLALLQDIENQPASKPTPAQRTAVNNLLNTLIAAITTQKQAVCAVNSQVDTYAGYANSDQHLLAGDLNTVVQNISNGAKAVSDVTAAIGENFLDSQVLGPCSVIVNIDLNITIKVTQTEADPSLITTIYAKIILQNVIGSVQLAQIAVQNISDAWNILLNKYNTVLSDLQDASDDQYAEGFKQLDIETAQLQWQQLAAFAQSQGNSFFNI